MDKRAQASSREQNSDGEVTDSTLNHLQPGQPIKAQLSEADVRDLIDQLYGLRVITVNELKSYDDRNFFIEVDNEFENQHIDQLSPDGYVLKVINSLDSKKPLLIDAQTELMIYMQNQGFVVNAPVKNVLGNYKSLEKIGVSDQEHLVRLLTFIPGQILYDVRCTWKIARQIGTLAARFDSAIESFYHPGFETLDSIWLLSKAPEVRRFLDAIDDEKRRRLVTTVLEEFEIDVMGKIDELPRGMIHGDLNEHNLIVRKTSTNSIDHEYEVYGILDFGDTQKNCVVFEVALAAIYCMLLGEDNVECIDFAGHVLAGYASHRNILPLEWDILKICMEARLCQSLIMGAYTNLHDPTNIYALTTAAKGWDVLNLLRSISKEDLYETWQTIMSH